VRGCEQLNNSVMRYSDCIEPKTNTLTLRRLNKLKLIRRQLKKERADKLALVATMYGGGQVDENEQEKQALQILKDKVGLEIDAAKIAQADKDKIGDMARRAIKKRAAD
jgi:hypothetical protein